VTRKIQLFLKYFLRVR